MHLKAFTCLSGAWQCVRLPFGFCNTTATFRKTTDMILAEVQLQICLVHLGDVIVFSRSPEECDNTPSQPHPVGEKASQAVSPGSPVGEHPPRKKPPKTTHARRRPGEDAPSGNYKLCDRKSTCPRRRPRSNIHTSPSYPVHSPSVPLRPSENAPQKPSKDPQKSSPQGFWGQSQRRTGEASDNALI